MRCVWCDSEYTFTGGEKLSFEAILTRLEEFDCNLVEITGGEPLAQKNVFPFSLIVTANESCSRRVFLLRIKRPALLPQQIRMSKEYLS